MANKDTEERLTMPVLQRYVRRLLSDSDRQYQEWKLREYKRLDRAALSSEPHHG